ncbi:hypothetical protein DDV93_16245 [Cereibacter johrii]|nr:hypothetical protein DDV93_16245 [Cereibacter johrii]
MSPTKLCGRFGVPWQTGRDKRTAATQKIDPPLASPIKDRIEQGLVLQRLHDRLVVRASTGTRRSGLVFIIRRSTDVVRSHCASSLTAPEKLGDGTAIRTLKEPCLHRPRFDSPQHEARAIGDWIAFHHRRPIPTLDIKPRRGIVARRLDPCRSARSIQLASCAASS